MDNFKRSELRFLIEGLDAVILRMREDTREGLGEAVLKVKDQEYNDVVCLQDRLIDAFESRFY